MDARLRAETVRHPSSGSPPHWESEWTPRCTASRKVPASKVPLSTYRVYSQSALGNRNGASWSTAGASTTTGKSSEERCIEMIKKAVVAFMLTLLMVGSPVAAEAVSVSSAHGVGTQYREKSYNNGAKVTGKLRVKVAGNIKVYYEGRVDWPSAACADKTIGRYSSNTASKTLTTRGGTISMFAGTCKNAKVKSRISRDITNAPDPSGKWSAAY